MKISKRFLTVLLALILTALAIITPLSPVLAAATVVVGISPSSGPPGAVLYVYATGCTAGSTFTLSFGTTAITSGTVPTGGIVSTWFSVPVLPRGAYDVTVNTTLDSTLSPGVFVITPQVFLNNTSGSSGDQLVISGNGFYPSSAITIYFDGAAQTPTTTVYSDSYGQFYNAAISVPQTYGGTHTVTASDYYGVSSGVTFTIVPKMTLSASTGAVGSSITISGTGFAPSSALSFFIDSTAINMSASTNTVGNFSNVALVIPATYGGTHSLKVQDASSNYVTADFTITAAMTIGPNSGPVDTSVAITGKGFLASHAITITYDGTAITSTSGSLTSDANGSFNANIKVPASSSGSHVITVSDATNSISANFVVSSTATINPTSGTVGTNVTASGSGFRGNSKVTITYNAAQVGTTTASAVGSFSTTFAIPPASTGVHSLVITDGTNTQTFSFSVTFDASISITSGYVGSEININGTGFGANKGVTVKYDADQVTSSTTDASGSFTASFKAPVSVGGNHKITVTDNISTKILNFAMDSTAPPVPALSLPANLTKLDKVPTLAWTEVKDPSGVTYTMQISKDAAFSTLILQKQGLTTPSYTLNKQNKEEKLKSASKSAPYYWRVKAIDAAGNESAWSTPQTFLVGLAIGEWAIYIIFGVVAILLGVGGFLLGRLMRPKA
jgi:hypothetical protein